MSQEPATAGVIAPPPLIFLAFLAVGLLADRLWPLWRIGGPAGLRWAAAALLTAAGLGLIVSAALRFRQAKTPPEPWKPSTSIVGAGPYRFTRNPMYLGMFTIYLAIALAADSLVTLLLTTPLAAIVELFVVRREERYLEAKFGDAYRTYRSRVRRWI
jgi:protein-S-isoprenylcysteine O-methyltransferase Ste14